jgi:hypothetical protein
VDENRFDDIAKALVSPANRRLTFGALLGGALGILGTAESEAAQNGKCRPDCDVCEQCNRGRCRRNRRGRRRCNPGTCFPVTGPACGQPIGGICQNGICLCPLGQDECGNLCRPVCPLGQVREFATCSCCKLSGTGPCILGTDVTCCSGRCHASATPPFSRCN